ncbi:hypothetical protein [Microbacterium sp. YJN-G]|nr:hypothetical protein [Microbacterium sp. YJN-G]
MTARADGSDPVARWIVGILCAAVVGGLLWLSLPMGPDLIAVVGSLFGG